MKERVTLLVLRAHALKGKAREAFIEEACGEDADLRSEVRRVLVEAERADSYFADEVTSDTVSQLSTEDILLEQEGDQVGPYILRQKIGEGGFGVVWMAEQHEPISRMVALKVVKAGMDTKQVLARFEAERQALAMMDHPNIAKVLDAGATSRGRPYFAMELVKGVPITEFCNEQHQDHRRRLDLFRDVCSAINHAHQKGVIHRDLKPSNVMVTLHGDTPVPKVIDFGIAKATQHKLTEKTLFTRFEQFLGTPVYMSHEQAAMSGLDIDTRSDIYSLGVLLYELLAGEPPFNSKSLLSAGIDEMRRIIREDEPPKPSTRLTQTQSTSSPNEKLDVSASALKGDLDWIVMKAIEKDRARRYETANAFAADIERYLNDEPIKAAAPSTIYRFRKFARRNKTPLSMATAIALLLVAATSVSSWLAVRAFRAENLANTRLMESRFNEGLSWMLRADVAEREGQHYPDTLFFAAQAIGFDEMGRPGDQSNEMPSLIQKTRHPGVYQQAHQWIESRGNFLPVWSSSERKTSSPITGLALSPSGRHLVASALDGSVRLWDFSRKDPTAKEIGPVSASPIRDIAFHPSGHLVAIAQEGRIRFWSLPDEAYIREVSGEISKIAYSRSGRRLAGAAANGSILIWSDQSENEISITTDQLTSASELTFSADDTMLAAVFQNSAIKVFHFGSEKETPQPLPVWEKWPEHHPEDAAEVMSVAFSPDMQSLAVGTQTKPPPLVGGRNGSKMGPNEKPTRSDHGRSTQP